ncbi:ATP-binding cassette domain-containing protein [Gemmiger formicilis]
MNQMHEINLKLNDLRKTYLLPAPLLHRRGQGKPKAKQALAGVSLTLGPGLYGLLGPNGAGKSTLIGIITGGLAADSGEVLWCGRPAHGIAFRRVLGYMPQQQGLYESYTGRRFLAYMAALKEIPRAAVPGEVARVAAAVNLTDELDKRLSAYSGGMKQRLLLAAALLGDPKLLILDEPTAGLDPKERVRLRTLLAGMAQNRIILVATHVVSDVESVATKVILLRAGKIVDAAPVPDLIAAHAPGGGLEDVYLNVFGEGDGK